MPRLNGPNRGVKPLLHRRQFYNCTAIVCRRSADEAPAATLHSPPAESGRGHRSAAASVRIQSNLQADCFLRGYSECRCCHRRWRRRRESGRHLQAPWESPRPES